MALRGRVQPASYPWQLPSTAYESLVLAGSRAGTKLGICHPHVLSSNVKKFNDCFLVFARELCVIQARHAVCRRLLTQGLLFRLAEALASAGTLDPRRTADLVQRARSFYGTRCFFRAAEAWPPAGAGPHPHGRDCRGYGKRIF